MKCKGCGCEGDCVEGCFWQILNVCTSCLPHPGMISEQDMDEHHVEIFEQITAIAQGFVF